MEEARLLSKEESRAILNDLALYRQLFQETVAENEMLRQQVKDLEEEKTSLKDIIIKTEGELATVTWESRANNKKNYTKRLWDSLEDTNEALTQLNRNCTELAALLYGFDDKNHPYSNVLSKTDALIEFNDQILLTTQP